MTENGKEYTYRYDRRGNLTEEQKAGIPIRRYTYDATGRMTMGSNLENGEKPQYTYNALYMRTGRHQTLTGTVLTDGNVTGTALPVNRMPASTETLTPEAMIGAML